jgi:hypothetical protein
MCGFYIFLVRPELPKMPPGTNVGIDVLIFFGPVFWLIALFALAAGFYWEFRRAAA